MTTALGASSAKRSQYLSNLVLFLRILPAILDHLSDIPVIITLYHTGYYKLFWTAVAIDLLPGPIATYQFYLLGYKTRCLLLLCHPINIFLYTFLAIFVKKSSVQEFSRKVVTYSHESQALLESPLQFIFMVTLICHGILPLPGNTQIILENHFGNKIDVSFFPILSVTFSLISIILNASGTMNIISILLRNTRRAFSWILFLISNITFRLHAWVILSTFLVEYVGFLVGATAIVNLVVLIFTQNRLKADPVLTSLYSLVFPIVFMKYVHEEDKIEEEFNFIKNLNIILSITGSAILLIALWILYYFLPILQYNDKIIIQRDIFFYFMISTTILSGFSMLSTMFIGVPGRVESVIMFLKSKIYSTPGNIDQSRKNCDQNMPLWTTISIGIRAILILLVIFISFLPLLKAREQNPLLFKLEVCGISGNETFQGYGFKDNDIMKIHEETIQSCPINIHGNQKLLDPNFELLACLFPLYPTQKIRILLVDNATATYLPGPLTKDSEIIMVSARKSETVHALRKKVALLNRCEGDNELVTAARSGRLQFVKDNINEADKEDVSKALLESARTSHHDVVKFIVDHEGDSIVNTTSRSGTTPLHLAAAAGDLETVAYLLDKGAHLDAQNLELQTPLCLACGSGFFNIAKRLVSRGADVNSGHSISTPLMLAARKGQLDIVKLLLESGADIETQGGDAMVESAKENLDIVKHLRDKGVSVNCRGSFGLTPLLAAVGHNRTDIVRYLLDNEADADVFSPELNLGTVVTAVDQQNLEMVRLLVEKGASVNYFFKPSRSIIYKYEISPLAVAVVGNLTDIVKFLLANNASVNLLDSNNFTVLHMAAHLGNAGMFELLLDHGADLYQRSINGNMPLHQATIANSTNIEIIKIAIEEGFNIALTNHNLDNCLYLAATNNHVNVVEYLLSFPKGAALANSRNIISWTPLHTLAFQCGSTTIARALLDHGAHVDSRVENSLLTPLMLAARNCKDADLLELLIDRGADVNLTHKFGKSALHYAVMNGTLEKIKFLISHGANVNAANDIGETPLHLAVDFDQDVALIELLLKSNANPMATTTEGNTALHLAAKKGNLDLVKLLLTWDVDIYTKDEFGKTAKDRAKTEEIATLLVGVM